MALGASLLPRSALACGGFFCSAVNPVNQAAERIVFAHNADQTVTAVIEIQYQGPSSKFSWLLPISSVPSGDQIQVASTSAFQRLQQATNPQYNLQVRFEGTCLVDNRGAPQATASGPGGVLLGGNSADHDGVTVEASGVVGSFDWTVISLDKSLSDPAMAAVMWLQQNGYDVPGGAPALLGPYLADGLYLLALKLQKGADTGSIRPIVLTYDASKPMIPIKLTAVAASDDMGVMTWILGDARAVPANYNALELNEARIDWFTSASNYNAVVTQAADDAGGQGFVTEMAGSTTTLKDTIWSQSMQAAWERASQEPDSLQAYALVTSSFSGADGLNDVVAKHATFADGITPDQIKQCPPCYSPTAVDSGFLQAVEENVIKPLRVVQDLIDAHPQVTRLYTTMSANEMTVDPLFTFNPDLGPVSNVHTATRVVECDGNHTAQDAPWRIELPQGGIIRGGPETLGSWPSEFASQPPNLRISREGESGSGKVVEDNAGTIQASLDDYSARHPRPSPTGDSGGCQLTSTPRHAGAWAVLLLGLLRRGRRGESSKRTVERRDR